MRGQDVIPRFCTLSPLLFHTSSPTFLFRFFSRFLRSETFYPKSTLSTEYRVRPYRSGCFSSRFLSDTVQPNMWTGHSTQLLLLLARFSSPLLRDLSIPFLLR
jgi:hypothetical protein